MTALYGIWIIENDDYFLSKYEGFYCPHDVLFYTDDVRAAMAMFISMRRYEMLYRRIEVMTINECGNPVRLAVPVWWEADAPLEKQLPQDETAAAQLRFA